MRGVFSNHPARSSDDVIEQAHPLPDNYPWIPTPRRVPPGERGTNWNRAAVQKTPFLGRAIHTNTARTKDEDNGNQFQIGNLL